MVRRASNTKESLIASTIRLVSEVGPEAATTRAIAEEAGVTEGAIYRHYRSKEALRWHAYTQIVNEMVEEKAHLLTGTAPIRQKLREWVRISYANFDRHPGAFTYVLLIPPPVPVTDWQITTQQGQMFRQLMEQARDRSEIRQITPQLALCHFTGLMLNVPRLINEGTLEGPATQHVDEVTEAAWTILRPAEPSHQRGRPKSRR